jgi:hypothetical protein
MIRRRQRADRSGSPFNPTDEFCVRALQLLDAGYLKAVVLLFRCDKPISRSVPRTSIALLMNY